MFNFSFSLLYLCNTTGESYKPETEAYSEPYLLAGVRQPGGVVLCN
jgi:hypothetical protein